MLFSRCGAQRSSVRWTPAGWPAPSADETPDRSSASAGWPHPGRGARAVTVRERRRPTTLDGAVALTVECFQCFQDSNGIHFEDMFREADPRAPVLFAMSTAGAQRKSWCLFRTRWDRRCRVGRGCVAAALRSGLRRRRPDRAYPPSPRAHVGGRRYRVRSSRGRVRPR